MEKRIELPWKYSPRWYQENFIKKWEGGCKRLMLVAHRRCLVKGTKISMADGTYKNIEDIKVNDNVLSWDGKKLVSKKVLQTFDNGRKLVYKYNDLEATPNHEVLNNRFKFVPIDEATHLVNAGNLSFGNIHNPELAELIGLLLSDGSIKHNQSIKFTNNDPILLDRFEYLLSKTFPECEPKRYKKNKIGCDIICTLKKKTGRGQHPIREYFKDSNTMPDIVWNFDKESTLAFLSGAISGDGSFFLRNSYISKQKTGFKSQKKYLCGDMVIEAGISPKLAQDYSLILLKFGIRTHIKKDPRGNNTRVFCYSLKRLHNLKGIKIYSKHKQDHIENVWRNTTPFNNFLLELIHKNSEGRVENVYDIEIEDTHNYVANGYIVHNCGKDKTVFAQIPARMMERVGTYFYFLPTYNQARKVIWNGADKTGFRFLDHFPKEMIKRVDQQEMIIETINGSILQLVGADNIDRIVGTNPIGVVFSEYSLMKPEVWTLISPILAENGGWAVFIFTPRGQNHAYDLLKKAQKSKKWHVEILPVDYTKALPDELLAEERMNMTEAYFRQEYYCDFTQNASAVFQNVKSHTYPMYDWKFNENGIYQLGVDLAKVNDYTVITPFDYTTFQVGPQDSFNQIDYTLQKAKIEAAYYRYNKARVVLDSTNNQAVSDDLANKGMNVVPFTFSQRSRNELLQNLQILLEQSKIKIPDDPELIHELESAVWDISANGTSKVVVPEPTHDDRMMSLALAVWDIPTRQINVAASRRAQQQIGGYTPLYEDWGI